MPQGGFDPYAPGDPAWMFDPVGQSPDWSAYHALSPGGRFPGDLAMFLEYLGAADPGPGRDPASPNPSFEFPTGLEDRKGLLAGIFRQLERDQRAGGLGPVSDPLGAGPAYFPWSGPGAPYGPEGGPLHGLLDQGGSALQDRDYGPDRTPFPSDPPRRRGGGEGGGGTLTFQPYQGMQHTPQFVGWQPIQPFTVGPTPTAGASSIRPAPGPSPVKPPKTGGGGGAAKPPRGSGGQGPSGNRPPRETATAPPPAAGQRPPEPRLSPEEAAKLVEQIMGERRRKPGAMSPTKGFREGGQRGYDVGYLDKGSPGWMRDPTTGILNTSGFPMPTMPSPRLGESTDEWMTRLHDMGFGNEDIYGALSGWGTGPVMRDPNTGELVFAKDTTAWVGPEAGNRYTTPIYAGGVLVDPAQEKGRSGGPSDGMWNFVRGGGGGIVDFLSDMFRFGSGNLY